MFLALLICVICGLLGAFAGGSAWGSELLNSRAKGGLFKHSLTFLPELFLALIVAAVSTLCVAPLVLSGGLGLSGVGLGVAYSLWAPVSLACSYLSIQTGHAAILPHQDIDTRPKGRDNRLTPLVIWICKKLSIKYETPDGESYTEAYVWVFWAAKGFFMTLPLGGAGLVGLPVGYEIGSHFKNRRQYWRYNPHFMSEFFAYALAIGAPVSVIIF